MDTFDILKKFGEYVEYDPEQSKFNLLSPSYIYHEVCDRIKVICDAYDQTGRMAVLYARRMYDKTIGSVRVKLIDLLKDQSIFTDEKEIYDILHGETVSEIENDYIEALNTATLNITGRKVIGERDLESEKEIMYESIESVANQLGSCNEDIYVISNQPVGKVNNISTKIHLFNYMAECVLTLQNANDGAYFCYINNNGTADGYFAIMIKSNGNLFSVNDRVSESYIGEHTRSRNGRWSEDHKDKIFPYEQIMTFDDHDYLGYASKYNIDESKLSLNDLDPEHYIPILLAIICVINGRVGRLLDDRKLVYINTLIKGNLESGESTALIELDKTGLIASTTQALDIKFDRDKFLSGGYKDIIDPDKEIRNQEYIDIYAKDFDIKVKPLTIHATNVLHELGKGRKNNYFRSFDSDKEDVQAHTEFIGNIDRMRRQAYYESRIELANHIKKNMKIELDKFGGIDKVKDWVSNAIKNNMKNLYPILARIYKDYLPLPKEDRSEFFTSNYHRDNDPDWIKDISILNIQNPSMYAKLFYNEAKYDRYGEYVDYYLCPITNNRAIIWFKFRIVNSDDIKNITGINDLIVPLRNWHSSYKGRSGDDMFYRGNAILDVVDAVDFITPFEEDVDFDYYIGFSKRGMNRLMKEYCR